MHIRLLISSLVITQFIAAQNFIERPQTPPFEGVYNGSVAFADVDGDNDQDLLITGSTVSGETAKLYTNDGTGNYTEVTGTPFDPVERSSIAFADVDGDNDQDVLISGNPSSGPTTSKLYTNDGNGNYTLVAGTPFDGVQDASIAFADVDGDNDQDVLITGQIDPFTNPIAKLYTNDGNGNFAIVAGTPFDGVESSSIAFADVDGDNDQDVLITGWDSGAFGVAKLYTNDGNGNFTEATGTPFDEVGRGAIAFADVDGDNDQDVLITGNNLSNDIAKLYTNDGNGNYTLVTGTPFNGVEHSCIAFADVDGDNDQDVLITGQNNSNTNISELYINDGSGSFTEDTGIPFDGLALSSVAFADVDGDNDQDVFVSGADHVYNRISKLYENTPVPAEETEVITACDTYTWRDGVTYTNNTSGETFTVPGAAPNGADSIYTLDLTILNSTSGTDSHVECDSYTWIDGNTYTSTNNTATHVLTNAAGCDSVVTLDLTITNSTSGTDIQTACDSYTWIDGNTYTSSNNTATHTLTNAAGCDSLVTLDLTITNSTSGTDIQSACDTYTWIDGNTYTSSNNTATYTLTNAVGCDSVVTLDLTINLSTSSSDVINTCDNQYTWIDGVTYTTNNNTATHTISNVAGCDSVITLDLTINSATSGTDVQTACDSYTWIDGITYTSSNNTATHTLTNAVGCDSVVTLDLTITDIDNTVNTSGATITANLTGASYQWLDCDNGYAPISGETSQSYTTTSNGNYAVEVSQNGCADTSDCVAITTVGLHDLAKNLGVQVYPNPASDVINIESSQKIKNVRLLNINGQLIKQTNAKSIEVGELNPGVYLVQVVTSNGVATKRIVKK